MSAVTEKEPVVKKANRLQVTKLNNKMVNQYWEDLFHAKEQGKLVCWTEGIQINPILQAADIAWCHGEAAAALMAARKESAVPQAHMETLGYDRELCSYARTHIGCGILNQSSTVEAQTLLDVDGRTLGSKIPPPDMIISAYPFCSTGQQWDNEVYRTYGKKVPIFNMSLSWTWGNKPSAKYMSGPEYRENVAFLKKQLQDCIRFIEGITGKPYDWDRLTEIMTYTKKAAELRLEAMQLCKARPSPASFFEWTNSIAPVNFLPGGPEIVDYFAQKKAEIEARIAQGVGSVPVEKYRLWWDGIMNWNKIGWLSDKFAGYDACMVAGRYTHMGFWQEPQVIDVRDPLDGMAQNYLTCPISISAPQVIEKIIEHCEFYEIDGLILHAARTCRAFSYPQFMIADAVGKRLGLPVAMFEGDMVDETFYKDEIVNSRVEAMLEAIDASRARMR
ncbi:MAG: 2-hydroxyacyl-CoA dehydratase family protein [Rhodocyclaceae bacterium]|nr:2-hydroxyacyl-CoA dehydratase family protein [Rhodocyclaceae bacterium]